MKQRKAGLFLDTELADKVLIWIQHVQAPDAVSLLPILCGHMGVSKPPAGTRRFLSPIHTEAVTDSPQRREIKSGLLLWLETLPALPR